LAALGAGFYWLSHAWLLLAVWRITKRSPPRAEWIIGGLVATGVVAVHIALFSMPLSQMIIKPWIR
jgi:hypothetical protein